MEGLHKKESNYWVSALLALINVDYIYIYIYILLKTFKASQCICWQNDKVVVLIFFIDSDNTIIKLLMLLDKKLVSVWFLTLVNL